MKEKLNGTENQMERFPLSLIDSWCINVLCHLQSPPQGDVYKKNPPTLEQKLSCRLVLFSSPSRGGGGVSIGIVVSNWTETPSVTFWIRGCAQSRLRQDACKWTGNQTNHATKNGVSPQKSLMLKRARRVCFMYISWYYNIISFYVDHIVVCV